MSNEDELTQQTETVAKTLWSETLIEMLIVALTKKKSDQQIIEILKELQEKEFKKDYIVNKVDRSMGEIEARRVRALLSKT